MRKLTKIANQTSISSYMLIHIRKHGQGNRLCLCEIFKNQDLEMDFGLGIWFVFIWNLAEAAAMEG